MAEQRVYDVVALGLAAVDVLIMMPEQLKLDGKYLAELGWASDPGREAAP